MPVSETLRVMRSDPASSRRCAAYLTVPWWVNLAALLNRLKRD
jgi:hypothetical protein